MPVSSMPLPHGFLDLDAAVRRATITIGGVAVVASLDRDVDDAVAANRADRYGLAHRRATIAVGGVAIVALFAAIDDPITTFTRAVIIVRRTPRHTNPNGCGSSASAET